MDSLIDHETLSFWLLHYGSIVLFVLLALGILILPVPEETMMVIAGAVMYNGGLYVHSTILSAYAGSITGITLSYILGRTAGHYLVTKSSSWIGLSEKHLHAAHQWFEKYGKWTLIIGYFIPGVRHFTGFCAGTTQLDYRQFALFAYTGAIIWVTTFLSIGYFFGEYFLSFYHIIDTHLDDMITVAILAGALVVTYWIWKMKFRKR